MNREHGGWKRDAKRKRNEESDSDWESDSGAEEEA
jgi:hypothetical protein